MVYSYLLPLLALSSQALAAFDGNLNYRSPSIRHDGMGIDVGLVRSRSLAKRDDATFAPPQLKFTHGVASGDPYADSVILWTRVAPSQEASDSNVTVSGDVGLYNHEREKYVKASAHPICVDYRVYADKDAWNVVNEGRAYTTSDIDFTVKVEAKDLEPFTSYWYQFNVCNSDVVSPLGRTKTAPAEDSDTDEISLAVHSCSSFGMYMYCPITRYPPSTRRLSNMNSQRLLQRVWQRRQKGQRRLCGMSIPM